MAKQQDSTTGFTVPYRESAWSRSVGSRPEGRSGAAIPSQAPTSVRAVPATPASLVPTRPISSTAPHPPRNPEPRIRSTPSSLSGQRGSSNYSGGSTSYVSRNSAHSSGAADFGGNKLHLGRSRAAIISQAPSSARAVPASPASLVPNRPPTSTAPHPPRNSERRIISTPSSLSGQRGSSNYSGASTSYVSRNSAHSSGASASAGAADFGGNKLHQRRPPIHEASNRVVKQLQLASRPTTTGSGTPRPPTPSKSYRESIRRVGWIMIERRSIASRLSTLYGQSGSNHSGGSASSSYISRYSGCSSRTVGDFGARELTEIAHSMVSDGYIKHMVQSFAHGGGRDLALKNWFAELDVDWVPHRHDGHSSLQQQLQLQDKSASSLQELIDRWVRALTIIVVSITKQLVAGIHDHDALAAARFGRASISAMLVVVAPIVDILQVENIQAVLNMYICVSSYDLGAMRVAVSSEAQRILNETGASLKREEYGLTQAISSRMLNTRTLIDRDDLWASEISQGGGEVNTRTQVLVDCILLMQKARALTQESAQLRSTGILFGLIDGTIRFTENLLLTKSKLCLGSNLRYLFLLNNSYFLAHQVSEPLTYRRSRHNQGLELTPECQQYMNSYLDVSWGHMLYCISNSHGEPWYRKKTSPLAEFQSEFHKTYNAQRFWKVPDPSLRSLLRVTISKRVMPGYRDFLKEHLELEEQVSGGSNSPDKLEEMLGQLFEGSDK